MFSEEFQQFLINLGLCEFCVLRYIDKYNFNGIPKNSERIDNNCVKRKKPNICISCLGIFDTLNLVVKEVIENSNLNSYDCGSLYSSISIPISLQVRELSIWVALLQKFPGKIDDVTPPCISIKDAFKQLLNENLCNATNRSMELNQNGILVNLFYDYDMDQEEIERLLTFKPNSLKNSGYSRARTGDEKITRNFFEKHYFPKNLIFEEYIEHIPVPPEIATTSIKFARFSVDGPTIYVAGRYRKLSRDLSQTPWILNGKRMKELSVHEIISHEIGKHFELDLQQQNDKMIFIGSGREDIDVRCIGNGRPFAFQIIDAKKSTIPMEAAAEIESRIEQSKLISVQYLQIVKREDLVHIKEGEEHKKKHYRALCILQNPATAETIEKLNIPNGFLTQQKTPLRVLHRRPLLTRPRQIFGVRAYINKKNHRTIVIDIVTQAGTYVKELVHGEFGRTFPSMSSILGQDIDIVALDVSAIDLDWPSPTY